MDRAVWRPPGSGRQQSPSWTAFGRTDFLSKDKRPGLAPLSSHSTAGDRGMCRRRLTGCSFSLCFTILQASAQPCSCFSGQKGTRHSAARLSPPEERSGSVSSFKIWSFESQLHSRAKTQRNCGARHVHGPCTEGLRARIRWKSGPQEGRSCACL